VISRRDGDDAACSPVRIESKELCEGAARLERSRPLEELGFQENLCPHLLGERPRAEQRGRVDAVSNRRACGADVRKRDLSHVASMDEGRRG
jgi:hypothetical protein